MESLAFVKDTISITTPVQLQEPAEHEIEKRAARRVIAVGSIRLFLGYFVPLALSESPSGPDPEGFFDSVYKASKGLWLRCSSTSTNPPNFEKWRGPPVGNIWCSRRGCFSSAFTVRLG